MRHVEIAMLDFLNEKKDPILQNFIRIKNKEDIKGVAPIISFVIQSDPVKEVGTNGLQALDILEYTKFLFKSLDNSIPCEENQMTIKNIEAAIEWQKERTKNREKRGVEGENKQ